MKSNYNQVQRVLWLILAANLFVALAKMVVGKLTQSTGLMADGFHSLADGSSNVIGLIGIRFASQPIDEEHPYGHHKFEVLASMCISGMLFVMGGNIIWSAINRLLHPVIVSVGIESLLVLLATLAVNVMVSVYEFHQGKKWNSQILIADAKHTRSDIFVSLGVLVTLAGIHLGLPVVVDGLVTLVVAGFILHAGYEIFMESSGILVDKVVVDAKWIEDIVMGFEEVRNVHYIRSRGSEHDLHIDMHIMTSPDLSVEASHVLIHDIENKIRVHVNQTVQLIAHLEPYDEERAGKRNE